MYCTVHVDVNILMDILGAELLERERVGVPHVFGVLVHEVAHRTLEHVLRAQHSTASVSASASHRQHF